MSTDTAFGIAGVRLVKAMGEVELPVPFVGIVDAATFAAAFRALCEKDNSGGPEGTKDCGNDLRLCLGWDRSVLPEIE